jgi:hypothetical protein
MCMCNLVDDLLQFCDKHTLYCLEEVDHLFGRFN